MFPGVPISGVIWITLSNTGDIISPLVGWDHVLTSSGGLAYTLAITSDTTIGGAGEDGGVGIGVVGRLAVKWGGKGPGFLLGGPLDIIPIAASPEITELIGRLFPTRLLLPPLELPPTRSISASSTIIR